MDSIHPVVLFVGELAALVTALGVLANSPPGRWIWARLFVTPIADAVDHRITAQLQPIAERVGKIEDELRPNGGHSMRDRINAVGTAVGAATDPTSQRVAAATKDEDPVED